MSNSSGLLIDDVLQDVDRSSLERAGECPRQARFIESGRVLSTTFPMESGNAVHNAISQTVTEYVQSQGALSPPDLQEFLRQQLAASRPDLQGDAMEGCRASIYGISRYLTNLHYKNIRRWDGGQGEQSGQLAWDLEDLGLRVTSELDLLHDGPSEEVIHELDWKSGHEKWTSDKVADSFQFQLHAYLVLHNFPDVQAVNIRVWNTRFNQATYSVLFKRESLYNYDYRVRQAALAYLKTQGKTPEACEAWPTVTKCEGCPAAALCDCTKLPEGSPEQWVDKLVALESQAAGLKKLAAAHVKRTGRDITTQLGNCFGTMKPKAKRAPTMDTYESVTKETEQEDAA